MKFLLNVLKIPNFIHSVLALPNNCVLNHICFKITLYQSLYKSTDCVRESVVKTLTGLKT